MPVDRGEHRERSASEPEAHELHAKREGECRSLSQGRASDLDPESSSEPQEH